MLSGIGWPELVIISVILLIYLAPLLFVLLALRYSRRAQPQAVCGSLDVRSWSGSRAGWLLTATIFPFVSWLAFFLVNIAPEMGAVAFAPIPGVIGTSSILLGGLVAFALMILYVVIAVRSPIPEMAKVMWCLAVVLGGPLVYPFAFYFLVWKPRRGCLPSTGIPADPELGGG